MDCYVMNKYKIIEYARPCATKYKSKPCNMPIEILYKLWLRELKMPVSDK